LAKRNKQIEKIFKAKRKRRKELASLSVEEKFKILLQLQKLTSSILQSRGIESRPWMTSHLAVEEVGSAGAWRTTPSDVTFPDNYEYRWKGSFNSETEGTNCFSYEWKEFQ